MVTTATLLLNAGHEATVNVVGNGFWALLTHPDALPSLQSIETAVEELIRYDTSTAEGIKLCAGFVKGWLEARDIVARQIGVRDLPVTIAEVGPEDGAPTLLLHGTEDKYVAHEQAVWLVERLQATGVEAELLTLPGAGHGFRGQDAVTAHGRRARADTLHGAFPTLLDLAER